MNSPNETSLSPSASACRATQTLTVSSHHALLTWTHTASASHMTSAPQVKGQTGLTSAMTWFFIRIRSSSMWTASSSLPTPWTFSACDTRWTRARQRAPCGSSRGAAEYRTSLVKRASSSLSSRNPSPLPSETRGGTSRQAALSCRRSCCRLTVELEEGLRVEVVWVQAVGLLPHLLQLVLAALNTARA